MDNEKKSQQSTQIDTSQLEIATLTANLQQVNQTLADLQLLVLELMAAPKQKAKPVEQNNADWLSATTLKMVH